MILENQKPSRESAPSSQKTGISPALLREQILNTVPSLFVAPQSRETFSHCGTVEGLPPQQAAHAEVIRVEIERANSPTPLERLDTFRLYVAAHWATCATFVPTDVDNHIRHKLWDPQEDLATLQTMTDFVLQVRDWPETADSCNALSVRWVRSPASKTFLSGHQGEWLSIASAAYGALRVKDPARAQTVATKITEILKDHEQVFTEFRKARDGIGALKATALIAHNLGDLKRVLEMWHVPAEDALWKAADTKTFAQVDALYKKYMADENPRLFALRKPRALRRSHRFLVGLGPFFDEWGETLARELRSPQRLITEQDMGDIVEALVDGWNFLKSAKRLNPQQNPQAYARALAGIADACPGGMNALLTFVPAGIGKQLKAGELRTEISVARARFTDKWNHFGLSHV